MSQSPVKMSQMEKMPFEYIGGSPALDFVNTVSWLDNGAPDPKTESVYEFDDIIRWAEGGEVLSKSEARAMRRLAKEDPRRAEQELVAALHLRRTLRDLFSTLANGDKPDGSLLNAFNRAVCNGMKSVELVPGPTGAFTWRFGDCRVDLGTIYRLVAWEAAQLATSERLASLRGCGREDCGWIFLDESRRRNRRWCQMEVCGAREKSKRHYEKVKRDR